MLSMTGFVNVLECILNNSLHSQYVCFYVTMEHADNLK